MNNDQQPGVPQEPEQPNQQHPQGPYQPPQPGPSQEQGQYPPAPGQPPYPPRADQYNFAPPPYGNPQQGPYGQPGPGQFGQAPPKGGIPVWGWVAGGVGVAVVLGIAGVMAVGGLISATQPGAAPVPTNSAQSPESPAAGGTSTSEAAAPRDDGDVYLFQDADFTSPPVWSTKIPAGWKVSDVKGGTMTYRSTDNPCIFTTHQAILPPRDATADEQATADTMTAEIAGIKTLAGAPVTVVTDSGSGYTKLRTSGNKMIELQEAELRFQNKSNTNLVYRIAARSMPASNGLMELTLVCPANLPTEADLWSELRDSVIMVDDPSA